MLEKLEDSLSCLICKELLDVPEQGQCDHAFCAICIRRYLTTDQHCPVCRKEMHAGGLKRVKLLENVVEEYKVVRDSLQKMSEEKSEPRSEPALSISEKPATAAPVELAQCPVCMKELPIADIQGDHIVECLKPRRELNLKRRPIVNYSIVKDKDLRALLQKDDLSSSGNRSKLIARHTEWTLQWNVNAQKQSPVTPMILRQNLHRWENALAQKQQKLEVDGWVSDHEDMYRELEQDAFSRLGRQGPRKRRLSEIMDNEAASSVEPASEPVPEPISDTAGQETPD